MRPRDATRSLKAITCVNNTQNSQPIIAFGPAQVQQHLSCSAAVDGAARSSSSARAATAGMCTAATHAVSRHVGDNCQRRANASAKASKALRIIVMPSAGAARVDDKRRRPWPISVTPRTNLMS